MENNSYEMMVKSLESVLRILYFINLIQIKLYIKQDNCYCSFEKTKMSIKKCPCIFDIFRTL